MRLVSKVVVAGVAVMLLGGAARGLERIPVLEPVQARLSTNFLALVSYYDHLFCEDDILFDSDRSYLDIGIGIKSSRFDGGSFAHRTRASLALPHLENRLLLVFNQLTEADSLRDRREISQAYEDTQPDVGLRLHIYKPGKTRLTLGSGVRIGSGFQVYGRLRGSTTLLVSEDSEFYLAQTAQYFSRDKLHLISTARYSWFFKRDWIRQIRARLIWRELEPGYEPELITSIYRQVGRRQVLRFDAGANWPNTPHTRQARYYLQGIQRWRLGRPWLNAEVALGVGFPQEHNFEYDPYIRFLIEFTLGNAH